MEPSDRCHQEPYTPQHAVIADFEALKVQVRCFQEAVASMGSHNRPSGLGF
jgi:hypothetical protein